MEEVNNPSVADPSEASETKDEGKENVTNVSIAKIINEATGRDYKSDEDAINGIKETTSYVGKVGKYKDVLDQIEKSSGGEEKAIEALKALIKEDQPHTPKEESVNPLEKEVEQLKAEQFFLKNKEYEPHKEVIEKLRKPGQSFEEVAEANKDILEKLLAYDESQKTKSVIHSNSRLTDSDSDEAKEFQKAKETGDWSKVIARRTGSGQSGQ